MRTLAVVAVAGSVLFTGLIGTLRILPQDQHPTVTLLAACATPCLLGIRPGVTSANDAIDTLEAHAWSGHIEAASFESGVEFFTWSAQHPDVMASWEWASVGVENSVVKSVRLPTRLRLGDVLATYGAVEWWSLNGYEAYGTYDGFVARFPIRELEYRTISRWLWSPVTLYFMAG